MPQRQPNSQKTLANVSFTFGCSIINMRKQHKSWYYASSSSFNPFLFPFFPFFFQLWILWIQSKKLCAFWGCIRWIVQVLNKETTTMNQKIGFIKQWLILAIDIECAVVYKVIKKFGNDFGNLFCCKKEKKTTIPNMKTRCKIRLFERAVIKSRTYLSFMFTSYFSLNRLSRVLIFSSSSKLDHNKMIRFFMINKQLNGKSKWT